MVRGRVVFVVLRSGDDDHDTDELSDALPLARFLHSHSRGLTGLDDQGAIETGRRINNRFPPELFSLRRQAAYGSDPPFLSWACGEVISRSVISSERPRRDNSVTDY